MEKKHIWFRKGRSFTDFTGLIFWDLHIFTSLFWLVGPPGFSATSSSAPAVLRLKKEVAAMGSKIAELLQGPAALGQAMVIKGDDGVLKLVGFMVNFL